MYWSNDRLPRGQALLFNQRSGGLVFVGHEGAGGRAAGSAKKKKISDAKIFLNKRSLRKIDFNKFPVSTTLIKLGVQTRNVEAGLLTLRTLRRRVDRFSSEGVKRTAKLKC
jgi:hypothetical protein